MPRRPHLLPFVLLASVLAGVSALDFASGADSPRAAPALGSAEFQPTPRQPVGWRGDGSGQFPAADPVHNWSAKENLLWKTEVGLGASSPLVVGARVLVTAEPDLLVCLDAATGRELWRKAHRLSDLPAELNAQGPRQSEHYGDTTPTPVSDGQWVWVFFNTGSVACYDLDGRCRWLNWYDQRLATSYGRHASPILVGDRLLVHFGPLVCLDAATGKLLWKNDAAKATYGTPASARIGDVDVVVTPKGHVVRITDGRILAAELGLCMYTSPVVQGRVVYFIDSSSTAVQLPEQPGEQIECQELWHAELSGDFYASPVIHSGRIYTVDRAANYYVLDAPTGRTVRRQTLELAPAGRSESPNVYPSVCLAGKHLVVGNDAGESLWLALGDASPAVGTGTLPAGSGGTPAFSGRRMFIRGGNLLYAVGKDREGNN